jgi:energy-converting hydrogenase Eha subunit E
MLLFVGAFVIVAAYMTVMLEPGAMEPAVAAVKITSPTVSVRPSTRTWRDTLETLKVTPCAIADAVNNTGAATTASVKIIFFSEFI